MAAERRQRAVLVVIAAFFLLFAGQLVNIQMFGHTDPLTIAQTKTSVARQANAQKLTPGLNTRLQRWWNRNVQAKVTAVPGKAKRIVDRVWKKLGAA